MGGIAPAKKKDKMPKAPARGASQLAVSQEKEEASFSVFERAERREEKGGAGEVGCHLTLMTQVC